jgi:methylmalonyl-CoA mutase N-terminal domain/subunit
MFDPDDLADIRSAKEEWESETLDPVLDRFGERKDTFETDTAGHEVDRLYTPDDVGERDYREDVGFPGE